MRQPVLILLDILANFLTIRTAAISWSQTRERIITGTFLAASGVVQTVFYVATDDNDSWSRKLDKPNVAKTDGPFSQLQRAPKATRDLKLGVPL